MKISRLVSVPCPGLSRGGWPSLWLAALLAFLHAAPAARAEVYEYNSDPMGTLVVDVCYEETYETNWEFSS